MLRWSKCYRRLQNTNGTVTALSEGVKGGLMEKAKTLRKQVRLDHSRQRPHEEAKIRHSLHVHVC